MLANPDIAPSASINRWIVSILVFQFELVHVPGESHGPDGLSRRRKQPDNEEEPEDDEFDNWIDQVNGFLHMVLPTSTRKFDQPPLTIYISYSAYVNSEGQQIDRIDNDNEAEANSDDESYAIVPRTEAARKADDRVVKVREWHESLKRPDGFSDAEYELFVKYCVEFFVAQGKLWKKNYKGEHKLVVPQERRLFLLTMAHDDIGHRGFYATHALVSQRYWWPQMSNDIAWFVKTCEMCQLRKTQKVSIPPVVAVPAPLFAKIYVDTMHLPPSSGYKFIVQGRCSLVHYPEFDMLRKETGRVIGEWLMKCFVYRWGTLVEIVSDNGAPFVKALEYIEAKYHIKHIRISGYNSRANGIVERAHFDVREALFKVADGESSKWSAVAYSVFWADRVTVRRCMGCSPYFAVTGTHPLLPLDIVEASYLLPPPESVLSTTDLIARRAITLQKRRTQLAEIHSKVYEARRKAAIKFEKEHAKSIRKYDFKLGDLVLMRHMAIEKSLNKKMKPRYLGPLIVIAKNKGGAYIIAELDGTLFDRPIAAFRLIPYFARRRIALPPLKDLLDVSKKRLDELRESTSIDLDELFEDEFDVDDT